MHNTKRAQRGPVTSFTKKILRLSPKQNRSHFVRKQAGPLSKNQLISTAELILLDGMFPCMLAVQCSDLRDRRIRRTIRNHVYSHSFKTLSVTYASYIVAENLRIRHRKEVETY